MNNYLIRFDETDILYVTDVAPGSEILGAQNKHIVCPLTEAIIFFKNAGYNIDLLITEFNKQ